MMSCLLSWFPDKVYCGPKLPDPVSRAAPEDVTPYGIDLPDLIKQWRELKSQLKDLLAERDRLQCETDAKQMQVTLMHDKVTLKRMRA
jgi:hypothetical protein